MDSAHLEKPQTIFKHSDREKSGNPKKVVTKSSEHPEWLPDGWNVEVKIRKSGSLVGSSYKIYIELLTGNKFYSKPEVFRYLETAKCNSGSSIQKEQCREMHSISKVIVENDMVEDLPPGWIKEYKIRKSSNNRIRKDPYYKDPVSGYIFRSKRDVMHYLGAGEISRNTIKPRQGQTGDPEMTKDLIPSSAVRTQKLKQQSVTRQLFVEGPDRSSSESPVANTKSSKSRQDVKVSAELTVDSVPPNHIVGETHSLENRNADPDKINDISDPGSSSLFKNDNCIKRSVKRTLTDTVSVLTSSPSTSLKKHVVNELEDSSRETDTHCSISKIEGEPNKTRRYSKRLAGVEPIPLSLTITNDQTVESSSRNTRKCRTTTIADLENGASVQLKVPESLNTSYHTEILNEMPPKEQGQKLETGKQHFIPMKQMQHSIYVDSQSPCVDIQKKSYTGELQVENSLNMDQGLSTAADLKNEKLSEGWSEKNSNRKNQVSLNKCQKKEHSIPSRASKRLAGFEPELMPKSVPCERAPEYARKKMKVKTCAIISTNIASQHLEASPARDVGDHPITNIDTPPRQESLNQSRKPLKAKAAPEEKLQKPDDEEIYNEKPEQLSFAFHYSWSDPCIDFAIKTLTGALPVEETPNDGPVLIPDIDVQQKNKLSESCMEKSNNKSSQMNSRKYKNKKESNLPRRISKRLAGHEPELMAETLSSKRAIEYAPKRSGKDVTSMSVISAKEAPDQLLCTGKEEFTHCTSNICGESSNKSEMPNKAQECMEEQHQNSVAGKLNDKNSEMNISFPYGDSWSDPCLEFAIKTLTGALPVEEVSNNQCMKTPETDSLQEKVLLNSVMEKSVNEETQVNSTKSNKEDEHGLASYPSKQNLGHELHLSATSISGEDASKNAATEFSKDGANVSLTLAGGASQHLEACPEEREFKNYVSSSIKGELRQHQSQNMDHENPGKQMLSDPLVNSWSHPCIEFATSESNRYEASVSMILANRASQHLEAGTEEREIKNYAPPSINEQLEHLQYKKVDHEKLGSQLSDPLVNSWSHPCLEFTINTLTGSLPAKENLAIPECLKELDASPSQQDINLALPNSDFTCFCHGDTSSGADQLDKSMTRQQTSFHPFMPAGTSLPSTGTDCGKEFSWQVKFQSKGV